MEIGEFIAASRERFVGELLEWLRIPSVSADPAHEPDVRRAAEWVADRLRAAGAEGVALHDTPGHPIVYGEKIVGDHLPTVLVYGHYDVQPADPVELWSSPAFEPEIRATETHPDGAIFARGAADDKGQAYMHVAAFEAMVACDALACNVRFLLEGEEEVGSVNLEPFVRANRELLDCDVVLISDTSMIANDVPSLTVGLRGLAYLEVEVTGPDRDLHSGVYGGAVANPINALCEIIAQLTDERGRITIPGFYDDVAVPADAERAALAAAPFDEEAYAAGLGIPEAAGGERAKFSTRERASIRPTLDVNGIWGGYTGAGAKTVLPSKARAKISLRLVPDQDPDRVANTFADHFRGLAPPGVRVSVEPHHGGHPVVLPIDSPEYRAAAEAMTETFGREPVPARGGGSIPIVALFERELGVKCVLMGFGLNSDDIHSPDEHFGLWNFARGIETIPRFYRAYASRKRPAA